jgi:hypothetical protein
VTRRTLSALALASVATAIVFAACTFPDVGFRGDANGAGASSSSGAGASTVASSASSSSSGTAGSGSSSSAASSTSSASSSSASSSGCVDPANPCDCDGDGDNANTPECDNDGGDCNDHDPLVNSKQTAWFTQPGSNGWDYDCSGAAEYEYPDFLDCGALSSCDGSTDKWVTGQSTPACGQMAQYGTCAGVVFFDCYQKAQGMRAQGCH